MLSTSHHLNKQLSDWKRWLEGRRLLLLLFVLTCLIYGPLYRAGFVTDFMGWLECRESTPLWQSYLCFGNRGLYYIPFLVLEFLTGFFWLHPLPWFLVWTGMHAVNAYLVADVYRRLASVFQLKSGLIAPLLAALIFLWHPWQVEVLAWKACVNYLFSVFWMLMILRQYLIWQSEKKASAFQVAVALFIPFLFTLEFALIFPLILALLHWSLRDEGSFSKRLVSTLRMLWPFVAAIGVWFCINKLVIGVWIGHYGAATHLALNPLVLSSAILKYIFKILLFTRFWEFNTQTGLYAWLDNPVASVIALLLIAIPAFLLLVRGYKQSRTWRFRAFLYLSVMICLVPIANLYFYYLQYSENDRYTYLAMVFCGMGLVALLAPLRRYLGYGMLGVFLIFCIRGTRTLVLTWEKSTSAYWEHLRAFPAPTKEKVFLLNVPDNYKGTYMFRNYDGVSAFQEVWEFLMKKEYTGTFYDVFSYNMTNPNLDFIVTWESPRKLKVEFSDWGSWWWNDGIGASAYENTEYKAWPEGKFYFIEFFKDPSQADILYHTPAGWKRVVPLEEHQESPVE